MAIYQGEPDALQYFESLLYWTAVERRQTWNHTLQVHDYDDVCRTEIYTLKTEEWHEWEYCDCYGSHPTHVTSVKWSKTAEKVWLTKGYVPSHLGVVRKHNRWAAKFSFQGQLMKEEVPCPA